MSTGPFPWMIGLLEAPPTKGYATLQQLIDRYNERDLRHITDPDAQTVNAARVVQALDDASAEIDGYLERRYALPLTAAEGQRKRLPAPAVLVRCACDIAVYRMQTLRPADDIKDARQRYDDVVKLLKAMAAGDVSIVGAALRADVAQVPQTQGAGMTEFGSPESLFGRAYR